MTRPGPAKVLERCMELFPVSKLGYDILCLRDNNFGCFAAGHKEKAVALAGGVLGILS
ncbi:MAG: hypothetical protein MZV63_31555 [Marinilabiliales bacterium]|nr:hypothetical protein [Marinilabiliales bacterium]